MNGCGFAENNLVLGSDGRFRPCCRFELDSRDSLPKAGEFSFVKAFGDHSLVSIRESLRRGIFPEGCHVCKAEEQLGLRSLRNKLSHVLINESKGELRTLEIFVGSLCNMKCLMCSPQESTQWSRALGIKPPPEPPLDSLFDQLDLKKISLVKFMGGEPLINSRFFHIIELLKANGNPAELIIEIPTNGSVKPSAKIIDALSEFRQVHIEFSVDGIGDLGESIRPGVPWHKIEESVRNWHSLFKGNSRMVLQVHTTLQAANYHGILEVLIFAMELSGMRWSFRTLSNPDALRLEKLPQEVRQEIADTFKTHPRAVEIKDYLSSIKKFGAWEYLTLRVPELT